MAIATMIRNTPSVMSTAASLQSSGSAGSGRDCHRSYRGGMSFRDHFSSHAASYRDSRPLYPPALFEWLAASCLHHDLAWDAGCGNGQASVALARHFENVFATDPSAEQIANASPQPRVRYACQPAETCSLPDACADLVTVAQAMHWFDMPRFQAEARRVLKPGGLIAAWTYAESRVDAGVDAVFDQLHNVLLDDYWPAGREHVISQYRDLPFDFETIATPAFEMRCEWTLPQYFAYLRSWSASQRHLRETGRDAVAGIAEAMQLAWDDPDQIRSVTWPLTLKAGRT
jgi:SAM-dependent methyltransferase